MRSLKSNREQGSCETRRGKVVGEPQTGGLLQTGCLMASIKTWSIETRRRLEKRVSVHRLRVGRRLLQSEQALDLRDWTVTEEVHLQGPDTKMGS